MTVSLLPGPRLTVQEATGRLDVAGQPFTFFVDTGTGRGSVVYHHYDGHYGLLVPAGVRQGPSDMTEATVTGRDAKGSIAA